MTDLEELVGERLMFGLPGPALREEDVRLFRDTRVRMRRRTESRT